MPLRGVNQVKGLGVWPSQLHFLKQLQAKLRVLAFPFLEGQELVFVLPPQ